MTILHMFVLVFLLPRPSFCAHHVREANRKRVSCFSFFQVSFVDRRRHRFYAHGSACWFLRWFNTLLSHLFFFAAQLHKVCRVALSFTLGCDRVTSFLSKIKFWYSNQPNNRGFWTFSRRLLPKQQTRCDRWENKLKMRSPRSEIAIRDDRHWRQSK